MSEQQGGFAVFQLAWPGTSVVHQLFVKEHKVRRADPAQPDGRTLFVLNPPLGGETVLRQIFTTAVAAAADEVETVTSSTYRTMVDGKLHVCGARGVVGGVCVCC